MAQDVIGEQPPDLVAAKPTPATIGCRNGCAESIGVGVIRQRHVCANLRRPRQQEIHRARFLRVRERHSGKGSVRLLLGGHHCWRGKSGTLERGEQRGTAYTVHRGVGDLHTGNRRRKPRGGDEPEIVGNAIVAEHRDQRIVHRRQWDRARVHLVDESGDVAVDGRHDLRPRIEIHLVTIVGWWVMRSSDHHPCRSFHFGDVPSQHRSWNDVRKQHRLHATRGAHARCVEREHVTLASRVVADDHALPRRIWHVCQQVVD